ncbi:hypothetical protein ACIA8K_12825 [Catenuloplanes sp. NPDC051500]|uniref:hypothetical protein n=1 Tax=Catenuloplanes sp. NPDC051500 TaxID=3363959 RepID=UPI0037BDD591
MSDAFPVASTPGRMPVPVFRVTFRLRRKDHKRFYEGERALKLALHALFRAYPGDDEWLTMQDLRIDLIAAAPINVTDTYVLQELPK